MPRSESCNSTAIMNPRGVINLVSLGFRAHSRVSIGSGWSPMTLILTNCLFSQKKKLAALDKPKGVQDKSELVRSKQELKRAIPSANHLFSNIKYVSDVVQQEQNQQHFGGARPRGWFKSRGLFPTACARPSLPAKAATKRCPERPPTRQWSPHPQERTA